MAAIEPDSLAPEREAILIAHEKTYHAFSVLLRWAMLHLAVVISGLTVGFATPGGFWGGLVTAIVVFFAGYYGMVRREEQQPLDLWVQGRKSIL
jgi:hypothetical protein